MEHLQTFSDVIQSGHANEEAIRLCDSAPDLLAQRDELLAECRELLQHVEQQAASTMAGPWWRARRDGLRAAIARVERAGGKP